MERDVYAELRPLLFSIAYRMLGSVAEAEDVVQEAFLRYHRTADKVASPKGFLTTVTTRLAIDQLRSARNKREAYVGQWLPEPILTEGDSGVHAETADSLSLAFLVLLESLTPVERAVFLLREVFDYDYDEIAGIVHKSEANCRQLALRARRRVEEGKPRFEASREKREELAWRFFAACQEGDIETLIDLLAADVVIYGDGGGKAAAAPKPIYGRKRAAKALVGFAKQARHYRLSARPAEVNGQPGAVFYRADGRPAWVVSVDIADGLVQSVRSILNPDKLRHLAPGQ